MPLVFINNPMETFTPTSSGALATIIWECCRLAGRERVQPFVITRTSPQARFPWPNTIALNYPKVPADGLAVKVLRAERKLTGWRHLHHRAYAFKVAQTLVRNDLAGLPLVLINDPEMTVYLRRRFPKAVLVHWFENQLECRPRFRADFAKVADVVLGVSDFTSRWVSDYYKIEDVKTLYNGVDLEQFSPAVGTAAEKPVINFTGRTGVEKAPDLLLAAGIRLMATTRNFSLQILGSNHWDRFEMDEYQGRLQAHVDTLEAGGIEVRRPGHIGRPALAEELRRAQIHVVPSRWDEPFGLTTVEGMASGLAVVASRTGGTPEIVGDSGFLFRRDSSEDLTACLEPLVTDASLRREYGHRARTRASEFPWDRTWTRLKSFAGV